MKFRSVDEELDWAREHNHLVVEDLAMHLEGICENWGKPRDYWKDQGKRRNGWVCPDCGLALTDAGECADCLRVEAGRIADFEE